MNKKITVNQRSIEWEESLTVDRILKKMSHTLKIFVIKVNGELIKKEHYKSKIIPEGADVKIIHLVSGG